MSRDEHRAQCIEANALALARAMFPERNLQSLDELGKRLKTCYLSAGKDGIDSLHGIAFVDPIEATPEMIEEAIVSVPRPYELDMEDRKAHAEMIVAILAIGDLTNPPEKKP